MRTFKIRFSTTHIILFSFLFAILIGALLLSLPISSAKGVGTPFIDALFTSTTATCVTGLVTVPTVSHWSIFGQVVILVLIQIGGLGIITVLTGITIMFHKRIGLADRILIQDAFNLNTLSGLTAFVKKVILGTFIIESLGAFAYMTVFVPKFGARGIWISFFNSISAFCNAGIDIIAENSLCDYVHNPIVNIVTCLLIILGGLGFIVWWDVIRVLKQKRKTKIKFFKSLTLHSKIALSSTAILIVLGAVVIFAFEYNNPLTFKDFNIFQKTQASLFQSVTTRTAGFATVPQENLSNGSSLFSILLMFIGGSPVGTAGGIKTVTFTIIIMSAISAIKGRNDVSLFDRTVSKQAISKAIAVMATSFAIMFISTLLVFAVNDGNALDVVYETVSATATVGLTRNFTSSLNVLGKIVIIITMYFGRVGPISLAVALNIKKKSQNIIKNPSEDISVG